LAFYFFEKKPRRLSAWSFFCRRWRQKSCAAAFLPHPSVPLAEALAYQLGGSKYNYDKQLPLAL